MPKTRLDVNFGKSQGPVRAHGFHGYVKEVSDFPGIFVSRNRLRNKIPVTIVRGHLTKEQLAILGVQDG